MLQTKSLANHKRLVRKAKDLTSIEKRQLSIFSDKGKKAVDQGSQEIKTINFEETTKQLEQKGFLKEKYVLRNDQPYLEWKNETE